MELKPHVVEGKSDGLELKRLVKLDNNQPFACDSPFWEPKIGLALGLGHFLVASRFSKVTLCVC